MRERKKSLNSHKERKMETFQSSQRQLFFSKLDSFFPSLVLLLTFVFSMFLAMVTTIEGVMFTIFALIIPFFLTLIVFPLYFGYWRGAIAENDLNYRLTGWILFFLMESLKQLSYFSISTYHTYSF